MRVNLEDNNFSHSVFGISVFALEVVQQRFGLRGGPMAFHQFGHSLGVMQRTRQIMNAFHKGGIVDYVDLCLSTIAATCHDVVQKFTIVKVEKSEEDNLYGRTFRKRYSGENERESAEFALSLMYQANESLPDVNFTYQQCERVRNAIMATVAVFDVNVGTVVQPALTLDCDPIARAVMLADIGLEKV